MKKLAATSRLLNKIVQHRSRANPQYYCIHRHRVFEDRVGLMCFQFISKLLGPRDITQWLLNQWSIYRTSNRKVSFLQKMCIRGNKEYRLENQESTSLNDIHFTALVVGVFLQNFPVLENRSLLSFLRLPITRLIHYKQHFPLCNT